LKFALKKASQIPDFLIISRKEAEKGKESKTKEKV